MPASGTSRFTRGMMINSRSYGDSFLTPTTRERVPAIKPASKVEGREFRSLSPLRLCCMASHLSGSWLAKPYSKSAAPQSPCRKALAAASKISFLNGFVMALFLSGIKQKTPYIHRTPFSGVMRCQAALSLYAYSGRYLSDSVGRSIELTTPSIKLYVQCYTG